MTMIKRAILIVSGSIQHVGYRETVHEIAFDMHLTGQVQNLENGKVEVIAEGDEGTLRELAKRIHFREFPVEVRSVRKRFTGPTGEFDEFRVIPDERFDKDLSAKMERGFRYFKIMQKDISGSVRNMDSHLSKDIKTVDHHIKGMDSHMGRRFDHLDSKYGEFGKTMKGMARDTRKSGKDARATSAHIKTMARDTKGMKGAMTGIAADIKAIRNAAGAPRKRKAPVPA